MTDGGFSHAAVHIIGSPTNTAEFYIRFISHNLHTEYIKTLPREDYTGFCGLGTLSLDSDVVASITIMFGSTLQRNIILL